MICKYCLFKKNKRFKHSIAQKNKCSKIEFCMCNIREITNKLQIGYCSIKTHYFLFCNNPQYGDILHPYKFRRYNSMLQLCNTMHLKLSTCPIFSTLHYSLFYDSRIHSLSAFVFSTAGLLILFCKFFEMSSAIGSRPVSSASLFLFLITSRWSSQLVHFKKTIVKHLFKTDSYTEYPQNLNRSLTEHEFYLLYILFK